ncbi:MAG: hypothetical protein AAGA48_13120 [Myxococcota bacterium]
MIGLIVALLTGCGGPDVRCEEPTTVLRERDATVLDCRRADWLVEYWELLRASPLPLADRRLTRRALVSRFDADPKGTVALLDEVRNAGLSMMSLKGADATDRRSREVFAALHGQGLVQGTDDLVQLQTKVLPTWGSADKAQVSLTEADVEAWIRYASLCREVQGGTALRISVADRVGVYRAVQKRFDEGPADVQRALGALGAMWPQVERAWQRANYLEQQEWIGKAPLPGPMTATSSEYARTIVSGDVVGHVQTLRKEFGPFTVTQRAPMFLVEDP